jgi:all-trans-8'-apo-beta-carotenal 15,15'-oxygenase
LNIKNPANTQVIAFGGKLLALFEAGLPYELNPETLETIGEDTMNGILPSGNRLAVDIPTIPRNFLPDFLGGAAHTAHPQRCPRTGNLVGWHWTDVGNGLKITVTEWSSSKNGIIPVASRTVVLPNVALAPHDMVVTENYIVFLVNALSMNTLDFISGMKGPAASLKMDGRADVKAFIISRPTSDMSVGPIEVQVPPCFCIHFSHGYEDEKSGNIVTFFSGWPPNDSKDFLGAWGGFAPEFSRIPQTFLWRLELDPVLGKTKSLSIAPGSSNVCAEHCVVHPNFLSKKANNVYAAVSNLVGDSSAPCGYSKHRVEDDYVRSLKPGERNDDIDCYFFGSRYFCGEPLVVPKEGADLDQEDEAYLLGIVCDAVAHRTFVSVFDLKLPLRNGPVANLWLKNHVPHGLHGCFDPNSDLNTSYFC